MARVWVRPSIGFRLGAGVAAAALVVLTGRAAVIHPGHVVGNTGLTNWTFDSGSVTVSGNSAGFFGSAPVQSDHTYDVITESAQTYTSVSEYLTTHAPNYANFYLTLNTPFTLPLNGTVTQNLLTAGGTIEAQASASANATVDAIYIYANASSGSSYFGNWASSAGSVVKAPMAQTAGDIYLNGNVYLTLHDGNNNTCSRYRYFSDTINGLAEGQTKTVSHAFDLSGETCVTGTGSITGQIALNSLPGGVPFNSGYVYASGQSYQSQSFNTLPVNYSLTNLLVGAYNVYSYLYFDAPFSSYLGLPNNYQSVQVQDGMTTARDFVFDAATLTGTINLSGPITSVPGLYGYAYTYPDYSQSNPPNYGAYSAVYMPTVGASTPYGQVLTAGPWRQQSMNFYSCCANGYLSLNVYDYSTSMPPINAVAGGSYMRDWSLDTAAADIVFDVEEPPATPSIDISYPYIQATMNDQTNSRYASIYAQSYAVNQPTPSVHVVGPPGHYEIAAYAQVLGSYSRFASATLELGAPINTPPGASVPVHIQDGAGSGLDVDLTFTAVTTGGDTTVSRKDIGPAPPGGFSIVPAFNGLTYLDIDTTAVVTFPVKIRIEYDPVALGIPPSQEQFLQLWHYNCSATPCAWENVTDPSVVPNPDTIAHAIYGETFSFSDFAILLPQSDNPPVVECVGTPSDPKVLATDQHACSVTVTNANGLAGTCADGGSGLASCTFSGQSSLTLIPGTYSLHVEGVGGNGTPASCTSYVRVADLQAPSLTLSVDRSELWPPNHQLVPIGLSKAASDICDVAPVVSCSASSNQPSNGTGDGNTNGDIVWQNGALSLRAERSGSGARVYSISCTATDAAGNAASAATSVTVPHDKGK